MYTPSQFAESSPARMHAFMRQHPFATLVAAGAAGVEVDHVPLLLDVSADQAILRGHVARANPLWQRLADNSEIVAIFHGPDHYISPGWYPSKAEHGKVVPTWNYAVVHARGTLRWHHDLAWLRSLVEALTHQFEATQPQPWRLSDAPEDFQRTLLGAIVGVEIRIGSLTGKLKLGQNRSIADRNGVIAALSGQPDAAAHAVAAMMKSVLPPQT